MTLAIVRINVSVTDSEPSVAVTVIVWSSTSVCRGVPDNVPELLIARLPDEGKPVAEYVIVSPSASAKLLVTTNEYAESSLALASAIADATLGASFTSVTATVNCVVVPLVSALIPEMVTVHEAADS